MSQSEVICITAYGEFFTGVTPDEAAIERLKIDVFTFSELMLILFLLTGMHSIFDEFERDPIGLRS